MENRQQNKYEISDASPEVLEHFAGQKRVKALVQTALEASWMDSSRFPDTLRTFSLSTGPESCR